MHSVRTWVLVACTLAACHSAAAQVPPGIERRGMSVVGIVLTAALEPIAVSPGRPVLVQLKTRNEGPRPQHFVESNPLSDFTLVVESEAGRLAPTKRLAPPVSLLLTAELLPNEEFDSAYPLTQAYDLSRAGTYRITAMRRINTPDLEHTTEVVSNTTVLTVSSSLSKDLVLSCSTGQPTAGSGRPVILHIRLKNVSSKGKTVLLGGALGGYDLRVQDFRGDLLHPKKTAPPGSEGAIARALPAGGSTDTDIDLSRLYDLAKGPRYFITAVHNVPGGKGRQKQVYSNTVVLTVTP